MENHPYLAALKLNQSLIDTLVNPKSDFKSFKYEQPPISYEDDQPDLIWLPYRSNAQPRLPKRIALPIIAFPAKLEQYIQSGDESGLRSIQATKLPAAKRLREQMAIFINEGIIPNISITTKIEDVLTFTKMPHTMRNNIESRVAYKIALKMTHDDLSLVAMKKFLKLQPAERLTEWPAFLHLIQKLRAGIVASSKKRSESFTDFTYPIEDIKVQTTFSGEYLLLATHTYHKTLLYGNNDYILYYNSKQDKLIVSDTDTLDYAVTHSEILFNLGVIRDSTEYKTIGKLIGHLIKLEDEELDYNVKVTLMKNYESACLMRSDIKDSEFVSWAPIVNTISEMYTVYTGKTGLSPEHARTYAYYLGQQELLPKANWLDRLFVIMNELTGKELQEVSSLHKFFYYAQIDENLGMEKYLKRVHTKRPCNPERIETLCMLMKQIFITNFYDRHNILPDLDAPLEKLKKLQYLLETKATKLYDQIPLTWFSDVHIKESLSKPSTFDPLEKAKDKGALRETIRHGPGDSQKELMQIIQREEYDLVPLPLENYRTTVEPRVYKTYKHDEAKHYENPTRLIPKEREQKIEARLFGNTTIDNKHGLSYYTELLKVVLSYFPGELMTISDKKRKLMLHDAGQLLRRPNVYSILLDIEGHNQSMQMHNVGPLAELCGNMFGESGWQYLSNYFNHLHVYHYPIYDNKVTVSEGQLGGIEGWQNPLWTLHTTLVVKLLVKELNWASNIQMVYSDDVAIITELDLHDNQQLESFFSEVVDFFYEFGMCVKPSQTVISKNRVTMLRNHYYMGEKSDATLKRLISSSSFNDDMLVSEEIEALALNSSISSAMEHTSHLLTCIMMKWYKGALICLRAMVGLIEKQRINSWIDDDLLDDEVKKLVMDYRGELDINWLVNNPENKEMMEHLQTQLIDLKLPSYDAKSLAKALTDLYGPSITSQVYKMRIDIFYYFMKDNVKLQEILYYRMLAPSSWGGFGFSMAITQMISGHSNGYVKQVYYLHEWIRNFFTYKEKFYTIFEHSIGEKFYKGYEMDETKVLSSEFPIMNTLTTATGRINAAIKNHVISQARNKRVRDLIALEDNREVFKQNLIDLTKEKYTYRIIRFYYEHSRYHILDLLLAKVESSRGFLKLIKNISKLRDQLFKLTLNSGITLFSKATRTYGKIDDETDMVEYLINMRKAIFPQIKFIDITEPLYDRIIVPGTSRSALIMAHFNKGIRIRKGFTEYLAPEFGNEALYKSVEESQELLFERVEQLLGFKTLMMTKWILSNSKRDSDGTEDWENTNISRMADLALATLNYETYKELNIYVTLPSGGEVLHRLPNMQYKTASNIRVLPMVVPRVTVVSNQTAIYARELEDSNINFDYLRMRIQIALAVSLTYKGGPAFTNAYDIETNNVIHNVQIDFTCEPGKISKLDLFNYNRFDKVWLPITETRVLCESYFTNENDVLSKSLPSKMLLLENQSRILRSPADLVMCEFHKLRKERMFLDTLTTKVDPWRPFIKRYQMLILDWNMKNEAQIMKNIHEIINTEISKGSSITERLQGNIDRTLLCDRLYEELHVVDLKNNEVIFGMWSSYKKVADMMTAENWLGTTLTEEQLEAYRRDLSNYLIRKAVEYITVKYALMAYISRSGIVVDLVNSMTTLHEVAINYQKIFESNTFEYFLMLCIGTDLMDAYLMKNAEDIVGDIADVCQKIDLYDICIINLEEEKTVHDNSVKIIDIPDAVQSMRYRKIRVDETFFEEKAHYSQVLELYRHASAVYADPTSYYSPTGSDSFCAVYGIMKTLMAAGEITKDTLVCDITAGRGDGSLAMSELGINHSSYTKTGLFNKIYRVPTVQVLDNYDIFKTETLLFTLQYDHIFIDISHVYIGDNDIEDALELYMKNQKPVTIRLNSIYKDMEKLKSLRKYSKYTWDIYVPNNGLTFPHQVYLTLLPKGKSNIMENRDISMSRTYNVMSSNVKRIMKYTNILPSSIDNITNSASILIDNNLTIDTLSNALTDQLEDDVVVSSLNKVLGSWMNTQYIELAFDALPKSVQDDYKDRVIKGSKNDYSKYNADRTTFGLPPRSKRYKNSEKHLKMLQDKNKKIVSFNREQIDLVTLHRVRFFHPIQRIRSTANAILQLHRLNIDVRRMVSDEVSQIKREYSSGMEKHHGKWSKSFAKAMTAVAYAAYNKDFKSGLDMILLAYHGDQEHRMAMQHVLEIYRKMGSVFNQLSETSVLSMRNMQVRDKIRETWVKQTARNHLFSKEQSVKEINKEIDESFEQEMTEFYAAFGKGLLEMKLDGNIIQHVSLIDEDLVNMTSNVILKNSIDIAEEQIDATLGKFDIGEMIVSKLTDIFEDGDDLDWAGGDLW